MSDPGSQPANVISLRADDKPVLFTSHRHDDRAIADVLRRFIEARTGGRVRVFQSSSPGARGPKQGENLTAVPPTSHLIVNGMPHGSQRARSSIAVRSAHDRARAGQEPFLLGGGSRIRTLEAISRRMYSPLS